MQLSYFLIFLLICFYKLINKKALNISLKSFQNKDKDLFLKSIKLKNLSNFILNFSIFMIFLTCLSYIRI